jgi:DNA polymerase-1
MIVADWAEALVAEMGQLQRPLPGDELAVLRAQVADLRCAEAERDPAAPDPTLPTLVRDTASLERLAEAVREEPIVAVDLETSSLDHRAGEIVGVGFAVPSGTFYMPTAHRVRETRRLQPDQLPLRRLADIVDLEHAPLVAHNAKFELKWIRHHLRVTPRFVWDTYIAARLLRSDKPAGLKELATRELDVPEWGLNSREMGEIQFLPVDRVARYCAKDCYYTLQLYHLQQACLRPTHPDAAHDDSVAEVNDG